MSGAPENNRWARGGPQQQQARNAANRQSMQDRSGNSTPRGHDTGNRQSVSSFSGNAWGNAQDNRNNRTGGGGGGSGTRTPQPAPQAQQLPERKKDGAAAAATTATTSDAAVVHVPVKGFNSDEVKQGLAKGYKEAIASASGSYVKVEGDSVPKRSSGVWANKQIDVKNMANGQNFWTQLSLQVQKLESGK